MPGAGGEPAGGRTGAPRAAAARGAEIRAVYRFRPGLDSARFTAIRTEGVDLDLTSLVGVSPETPGAGGVLWAMDTLPGLVRLAVRPPGDAGLDSLSLSWTVHGPLRRLPLFVPATPTRPAASRVRLEVAGGDFDVAAGRVFPRMERESGRLVGRPENLPSFLLLSPAGGGLTVDRAADWSVVLLVLVATAWWAVWRRRAARRDGAGDRGTTAGATGRE